MKQDNRYFAIGLFVASSLGLLVAGCLLFGGGDLFAKKTYFETYFDTSVQGLDVGGAVKFRGVRIGTVESIGFAGTTYRDALAESPDTPGIHRRLSYVRVLCSVDLKRHPDYDEARLRRMAERGMRASLALQGITGMVFVNLDFVPHESLPPPLTLSWEPEELYVPSVPTTLQNLLTTLENIAKSIESIDFQKTAEAFSSLATTIDTTVQAANIPALTEECRQLVAQFNRQATHIAELLDAVQAEALRDTAENLRKATDDLQATYLPQMAASLEATLSSTRATLDEAKALIERLAVLTADTQQNLSPADVGETMRSLSRTAASLEGLVEELREKPSRLIFDDPLD